MSQFFTFPFVTHEKNAWFLPKFEADFNVSGKSHPKVSGRNDAVIDANKFINPMTPRGILLALDPRAVMWGPASPNIAATKLTKPIPVFRTHVGNSSIDCR